MFNLPYVELTTKVGGFQLIPLLAELMGVSERTIRNWQKENELNITKQVEIENAIKDGIIHHCITKQKLVRWR